MLACPYSNTLCIKISSGILSKDILDIKGNNTAVRMLIIENNIIPVSYTHLLGHRYVEALGGLLLGIAVALVMAMLNGFL